ncbi:23S rRNA (guanine(745)-N(1))-methyltransferase [Shewanella xiamenensis]|uniref:23S rRNA (guanine(745)-N(1))-methyltransferase n=1 Tax=Shewanella xiamenensis TaxID=332186 RepID=UPI0024A67698|nr:23S rRNA (guanine(745)-N(1))-methyltransferase [Shewanella xiamenensis]MDI5837705.1 23S rRNA (guanine(745)-N(1))-methyltransferase [Shewanella xiamenensis]MDI5841256.1 23S rRNA (guanine(745)-N(1))-methyltransferase [Shewanella xiamenensis]MDI5844917.1 23S rRNA (guanine(745)-N(1))-methyltransferase [Shewanella xiamenensis]MDI5848573.1 23S rRNA (guanine(745)-N(1))-methyltransferase [Shewanella xiamenensis]MDI5852919.1 23S rRNA (guanine(745)-N(1))-methyltransferase [Shewanella xiamenensis]
MQYICPLCALPLTLTQRTWGCPQAHKFDMAKEGYVNLLPVQKKNSKDPGDNQQMMFARREFLNAGYYQILSDRVNQLALQYASSAQQILDIGCGEGYYSHRLYNALVAHHFCYLQGVDISKSAIKYAAKRYPNLSFCVASAYEMPIPSNSIDLAIRIYAPSKVEELQRIMAPSGILITVSPGPLHHFALKQQIYDQPRLHPESEAGVDGFECLHQERLSAQLDLNDSKDIGNFLEMTPYAWKFTAEQKQAFSQRGLSCELDFQIEVHRISV